MPESARVNSLDALGRFRASFADFGDEARLALGNAENDIQRTLNWLQAEQQSRWQREIKIREKRLMEAKSELQSAELQARETRPSLVLERKRVQRAQAALEEAQRKLESVRHWVRVLDREIMLYKGQTQSFAALVERNVPAGLARLAVAMDRIEKYIKLAPPAGDQDRSAGPAAPADDEDEGAADGQPEAPP
jgi:chromosome segregation ATPase